MGFGLSRVAGQNVAQASRLRVWAASRRQGGQGHRAGRPDNPQAGRLRHVFSSDGSVREALVDKLA